jgi:porin
LSAGIGYQAFSGRELPGVVVDWGRPNKDTFGPRLDDQWTLEVFYRWQVLREIAVTPSVQPVTSGEDLPL